MIKNINKKIKILLTCSFVGISSSALALDGGAVPSSSDISMKIGVYSSFQSAFLNQKSLSSEEKTLSPNNKNVAFSNDAAVMIDASRASDSVKYGLKVYLVPTVKRKGGSMNGSHIYLETEFGKVELGSPRDAATNMSVSTIAAGAKNVDTYVKTPKALLQKDELASLGVADSKSPVSFAASDDFFLGQFLLANHETATYSSEPSRKISYYTPKFNLGEKTAVNLGVSFVPDSSNTGAGKFSESSQDKTYYIISDTDYFVINQQVKNAFSGAVNLEHEVSDSVDLKLGAIGEFGKAANSAKEYRASLLYAKHKISKLAAYGLGAALNTGNFTHSLFYGDLGKSLTTKEYHKAGRKTKYYKAASMYSQGPFAVSISYFKSQKFKNDFDSVSLGTDYLLAAGLKTYVEVSTFAIKGRPEYYPQLSKKKSKGSAALIGAQLNF